MQDKCRERFLTAGDIFSREEIRELTTASNLRGALSVLRTWLVIALCFVVLAWAPNPLMIAVAIVVLGSKQLALAVLMHECAHRSLFASRELNAFVGHWFCGAPTWSRIEAYREHHLQHHTYTGTDKDPDRSLVDPFPTTPTSFGRKVLRDLSGVAGFKRAVGLMAMDVGFIAYTDAPEFHRLDQAGRTRRDVVETGVKNFGPTFMVNGLLWGVLFALGHGWLYALWCVAWLTTYGLFLRVRAIAEHACTDWTPDRLANTRTTKTTILSRLLVAPHDVNYHLEHHLLMTVPHYNLARMHVLLKERGHLTETNYADGYAPVLRMASSLPQ